MKSIDGSGFSDWKKLASSETRMGTPSSAEWQSVSVTAVVPMRGGFTPPHRCPNSLQRNEASGPSGSASSVDDVAKIAASGGAEQSSSLVMKTTASRADDRRNPTLAAGIAPR